MTSRSSDSEDTHIAHDHAHENDQMHDDVEKQQHTIPDANPEQDLNLVKWEENDKENPLNWSSKLKIWITFQLGMLAMAGSLASSIVSPANETISEYIGVSKEIGVLSVSLYM